MDVMLGVLVRCWDQLKVRSSRWDQRWVSLSVAVEVETPLESRVVTPLGWEVGREVLLV